MEIAADNLEELLEVFPPAWRKAYRSLKPDDNELIEFVADLGRFPLVRFQNETLQLIDRKVDYEDLNYITERVGVFSPDNRAGINEALHRISAIRSRSGKIVGITARVGRAVYGDADIVKDILKAGRSILLLGKPGVGKTTVLREMSRVLADDMRKRVVIVDTSNEIAGDGDIPHPGVGGARRMQVAQPSLQHNVMIEAVENHTPEVVIIDEIGTEAEAYAARTIAERGVMLVATAHGIKLENLIRNPSLCDLVGGIESVTLSDEVAFKRGGGHKEILERKAPPTFDVVIELRDRNTFAIHKQVSASVDAILRGEEAAPIVRVRGGKTQKSEIVCEAQGDVRTSEAKSAAEKGTDSSKTEPVLKGGADGLSKRKSDFVLNGDESRVGKLNGFLEERFAHLRSDRYADGEGNILLAQTEAKPLYGREIGILPVSVSRNRLDKLIHLMEIPARLVSSWKEAEVAVILEESGSVEGDLLRELQHNNISVYYLKDKGWPRLKEFLEDYFDCAVLTDEELAEIEVREAVAEVLHSHRPYNLLPQNKTLRALQRRIAGAAGIKAVSFGAEPDCYVRLSLGGKNLRK
ncbi:AAA family ATPase [bacterium]|nr:AAA family ATPase [bacterium]